MFQVFRVNFNSTVVDRNRVPRNKGSKIIENKQANINVKVIN